MNKLQQKKREFKNLVKDDNYDLTKAQKLKNEIVELQDLEDTENLEVIKGNMNQERVNNNIFNSTQKVYKPESNDLHIYDYMEAVMDKPQTAKQYEAVQNSITSEGYTLPESVSQQLIDRMRASNPVVQAGAQTALIESGSQTWVKVNEDPKSQWHSELNEESNSSGSFSNVKMESKTLMSVVEVSRELLQDSNNAGEAITTAMVGSLNDSVLNATFSGTGTDQPEGLGTLISQEETYSGSVDYSNFIDGSKLLYDNNVPESNRSFIYSPTVWQDLSNLKGSDGHYIASPESIKDVPKFTSSGVPTDQSYIGDFSRFVYGYSLNITIEKYNSASVNKYGTKFLAVIRLDQAVTHPNAFVRVQPQ